MTPFERVIARRPEPNELYMYARDFERWLDVTWAEHAVERDNITDDDGGIAVGPELTRDDERIRYLAQVSFMYTGTFGIVLDIRRGPARETDDGMCELGPIITGSWSRDLEWYEYGADLVALRAAGVALSWEAAQWLHAAGRAELDELHAHGRALSPRPQDIRLRLLHTPFTESRKHPGVVLDPRDSSSDDDFEPPAAFAFVGRRRGASHDRDHALLAAAIGGLTRHPDPPIDELLRDPDPAATQVLHDLLLQRGRPIEPLLRDLANVRGLPDAPLVDIDSIDDEFDALWSTVIELDPMLTFGDDDDDE